MQIQTLIDPVSSINKTTYARPDVLKYYHGVDALFKTERMLFDKLYPKIKDSKILDIGVGGGRTTSYLMDISPDYTGVDYVAEFAEQTAIKYPEARILWADATDLKEFESDSFDFVLFSYNGLDSISNQDRHKVLKETHRVLKNGGIFMFSSHNRDYRNFNKLPWQRTFHFDLRYVIFFLHCILHLPNHFKMKKHEVYTDDYAIVNDGDHRYSLLLYYISIGKQVEQLLKHGFVDIEAYDGEGRQIEADTSSHWIYYLATKTAA